MRHQDTLTPDYFETMFSSDDDPWSLESSAYEAEKFEQTIQALGGRRYATGFEAGCAGGMLTTKLAGVCDQLLSVDVSETALKRAKARCAGLPQVRFDRRPFPKEAPLDQTFDLIVLSEVVYYLTSEDTATAARWAASAMAPGGDILLVHWLGETDYPQSGDEAVETFRAAIGDRIEVLRGDRHEQYRLDLWRAR